MKNYTPLQVILLTALLSAIIITLVGWAVYTTGAGTWLYLIILFVLSFSIMVITFRYSIEKFINRRIKLIYKLIHDLKSPDKKNKLPLKLNQDMFNEINLEVTDWAKAKKEEVETLRQMGEYRRDFLTNVSHELKTPIFNIQGYLHTLLDGGLQDENINEPYLQKAVDNLDHLSNIIHDLEIITRLESGEVPLKIIPFDIYELVLKEIELAELMAAEREITIDIKEGCRISRQVLGDKDKIHQVIQNLISNSIKYGKPGGKTSIGLYDMYEQVLIEVSDNGIGIEKEDIPHLFERFYRVDKARSRKSGGSGLGLAIVKHILEAHGERIHIRSTPGVGTTFGFTLKKA